MSPRLSVARVSASRGVEGCPAGLGPGHEWGDERKELGAGKANLARPLGPPGRGVGGTRGAKRREDGSPCEPPPPPTVSLSSCTVQGDKFLEPPSPAVSS